MPKQSIISAVERRKWLEDHENGMPFDEITIEAKRDQRTIKVNVERARLERDFEVAQREQLRAALRCHQEDMLALMGRLMSAVYTPELAFNQVVAPDFGLESLLNLEDLGRYSQVSLGPALPAPEGSPGIPFLASASQREMLSVVTVVRDGTGPTQVLLADENSTLWRGVKEHIGTRDPLWRYLSQWKQALLDECQARAGLNRAIRNKAEEDFGMPVVWETGHRGPHLAAAMVGWARTAASRVAQGEQAPEITKEVRWVEGGRLETVNGLLLSAGIEDSGEWEERLQKTLEALAGLPEVGVAALAYRTLQDKCTNVHRALEEYLLIHHLPGRCGLCRKLGG